MMYMTVDLLACPYCKDESFPLELCVLEEREVERELPNLEKPYCELYCAFKRKFLKDMSEEERKNLPCEKCAMRDIYTGVLFCNKCGRWYPIIEGIPHMLPDELRNYQHDKEFFEKYKEKIKEKCGEEKVKVMEEFLARLKR